MRQHGIENDNDGQKRDGTQQPTTSPTSFSILCFEFSVEGWNLRMERCLLDFEIWVIDAQKIDNRWP